jgi:hypothetical protein
MKVYTREKYIFRDVKSIWEWPPASKMNLEHNIFVYTISKTIHLGTIIISLWLLLLRDESLYLRKVYFLGWKVHVGMTAGVQNESRAQYFQPYYLENDPFRDQYNLALDLITPRWKFIPEKSICDVIMWPPRRNDHQNEFRAQHFQINSLENSPF